MPNVVIPRESFEVFALKCCDIWGISKSAKYIEEETLLDLFTIRKTLNGIFRDVKVENQWLREPQELLGNKTPLELLETWEPLNISAVRQMCETMAGL